MMDVAQVRSLLRETARPQVAWAKAKGLSPSYVSDVLNDRRDPSKAILDALGLVKVVTYEPAPRRKSSKPTVKE